MLTRILLVPSSDYLGHPFPQRHNQIFERLHDGKNFEVHVAAFGLFESQKLNTKLRIHVLRGSPRLGGAAYYLANMLCHAHEIAKIVADERIDLVVLSNLAAPFAYVLLSHLTRREVPIVLDLPDYYPTSATGYITDVHGFSGKLLAATFDLMLRYIIRHSDAVTAPSRTLLRYAKRYGARQVFYVPNGISEEFLTLHDGRIIREKLGFGQMDLIVGYVGSIDFWLDLRPFLASISLAKKMGLKVKGLLIGRGLHTQTYSNRVTSWIAREGLQEDVTRLDFVPHKEVPEYMAAIDVGTIPFDIKNLTALYSAPIKIWEYLSQKKPVISSPIPETLDNSDCLLVASEPFQYLRHFSSIHSSDMQVAEKVRIGYDRACRNTWKRSVECFVSTCEKVMEEHGRAK